jgi:hypothetical protein
VPRQHATEERREAKKAEAQALVAERAFKKQQRDAATAENSGNTANIRKRKASHKAAKQSSKGPVVMWLLEVVLTLHCQLRLPHLKSVQEAAIHGH